MGRQRIIVVGGVAAGPAAATQARRTDPDAEVILFERGQAVSYSACELPYLVAGVISQAERVIRLTPGQLSETRGVDVRTGHDVTALDAGRSRIAVRDLATGHASEERFDKLILATGAAAGDGGVEDVDGPDCHRLRTLKDALALREAVEKVGAGHVVVVGAGFIGLEMATLLAEIGSRVTVLGPGGPLDGHLEAEAVAILDDRLGRAGIAVRRERAVRVLRPTVGPRVAVETDGGERIGASMVVIAAGIRPATSLGEGVLKSGPSGTYAVDAMMGTTVRNVWACGDCVSVPAFPDAARRWIPLSPVAFRGARVAGHNAARRGRMPGRQIPQPVGAYTARIAGLEVAAVGLTASRARSMGFEARTVQVRGVSSASALPGSSPVHVGLVFDSPSGRLLGGQLLGTSGAAVRANVVSAVLAANGSVSDLYDVDYVYAPPVAPSFDPLMVAARAAQREAQGR